jgi:FKBP12-rapamycin complex-associated protein
VSLELYGRNFAHAISVVIRVQMLSELEEIIAYKDHADQPERQATQRKTWQRRFASRKVVLTGADVSRLEGCQRDVEVWQRVLQVRSLVLTPHEDMDTWIHFADLCRTSDRLNLAEKTLTSLVGSSYSALDPEVGPILPLGAQSDIIVESRESSATSYIRILPLSLGKRLSR